MFLNFPMISDRHLIELPNNKFEFVVMLKMPESLFLIFRMIGSVPVKISLFDHIHIYN